jgi:hypothetical protein
MRLATPLLALAFTSGVVRAGTETDTKPAPPPPAKEDALTGVLNLDLNTHFISYGNDAWKDGSSMSDLGFNPSLEFSLALPQNFVATLGTWWDVNDKGTSPIGGKIQEIDVWGGLAYTFHDFTVKTTYQAWNYGSSTEDILDIGLSYKCFLSPSLTIHNRLNAGSAAGSFTSAGVFDPGDEGTVLVGALSWGFDAGPVSIAFPLNVAYFCSGDYHAVGADSGFGYGSLGATASVPISFIDPTYGKWSLHGGLTYYVTSRDVIPNNPKGDFLTANLGISVAF